MERSTASILRLQPVHLHISETTMPREHFGTNRNFSTPRWYLPPSCAWSIKNYVKKVILWTIFEDDVDYQKW